MNEKIRIRIVSGSHIIEVMEPPGVSLETLAAKYYERTEGYFPVFASVNDVGRDLLYRISRPAVVKFMDLRSRLARLVYQRSIYFLYLVALNEVDPEARPSLKHPLNDGIYIKINNPPDNPAEMAWRIEKRMREMIAEDVSFSRKIIRRKEILSENPPEILSEEQIDYIRNSDIREVFEYTCRGVSKIFCWLRPILLPSSRSYRTVEAWSSACRSTAVRNPFPPTGTTRNCTRRFWRKRSGTTT